MERLRQEVMSYQDKMATAILNKQKELLELFIQWEAKVQQGERDFDQISKTIRKELGRFEKERVRDFKTIIIKYLESLVRTQQQLIKYWEAFLPEAKAIA